MPRKIKQKTKQKQKQKQSQHVVVKVVNNIGNKKGKKKASGKKASGGGGVDTFNYEKPPVHFYQPTTILPPTPYEPFRADPIPSSFSQEDFSTKFKDALTEGARQFGNVLRERYLSRLEEESIAQAEAEPVSLKPSYGSYTFGTTYAPFQPPQEQSLKPAAKAPAIRSTTNEGIENVLAATGTPLKQSSSARDPYAKFRTKEALNNALEYQAKGYNLSDLAGTTGLPKKKGGRKTTSKKQDSETEGDF